MAQRFADAARTTLASGISDTATTLTVALGDAFPVADTGTGSVGGTTDWFKVVLDDDVNIEIVYVRTHAAGSEVFSDVLRGREGTTARAWSAGAVVGLRWTAADAAFSVDASRNPVINGAFLVDQIGLASVGDDQYAHDQWYALTQTGAIAPSTLSNVEDGTPRMARLTQSQASAQRFGYAQIIESVNCVHLRGQEVTLQFGRVRMSAAGNLRFAVLEWTGTADAVTSDVVADWASSSYSAGGFFLGSGLTVSGVAQQVLAANTLTDGVEVTVSLGSAFNNLIVVVWTEGAQAQNVTLDLAKVQISVGSRALPFRHQPLSEVEMACFRYYYRIKSAAAYDPYCIGGLISTTTAQFYFLLPVPMRVAPTGIETSAVANFSVSTSAILAVSDIVYAPSSKQVGAVHVTHATGTLPNIARLRAGAGDYIGFTGARL